MSLELGYPAHEIKASGQPLPGGRGSVTAGRDRITCLSRARGYDFRIWLSFRDAVGSLPRSALSTSSASVRYRSPIVPATRV